MIIEIGKNIGMSAGELLKHWRSAKGLSARGLSISCGLSPSYISKMESGGSVPPVNTFMRIAKELDLTPDQILLLLGAFSEEKNES